MKYLFFSLGAIFLATIHTAIFFIWKHFLDINDPQFLIVLSAIVLIIFSLSVIGPVLVHWRDNRFSRLLYLVVAFWMGFIFNTFLLTAPYFIIITIFPSLSTSIGSSLKILYIAILPALMIVPEAWAAREWKIKRATVAIDNLPDYWVDKEVVHLSDVHLGPILRQKFFDKLLDRVEGLKAEAIFLTGDLFDGMEANFSWFNRRQWSAPSGTYYSFGNHDVILGKEKVKLLLNSSGLKVLDDELHEEKGLQIMGLSFYTEKKPNLHQKLYEELKYSPEKASVLLYHEPKDIREMEAEGIDLQLSGHTHAGQMWPLGLIAKLAYRGFVHGIYRIKDYTLSVSSGTGTWGPPLRLGSRSEIILLKLIRK